MDIPTARFTVSGRVQGVGFRQATAAKARQLGLSGWVRNRDDGQVEGLASGDAAAIAELQRWLQQGPPLARVTELQWQPESGVESEPTVSGFEIRR